jgi:hypothetical protein
MSRIRPQCLDADCSDRSVSADVLLRQEPDEEEDEGDRKEGDDDEEDDGGYSVRVSFVSMVKDEARRLHQRC